MQLNDLLFVVSEHKHTSNILREEKAIKSLLVVEWFNFPFTSTKSPLSASLFTSMFCLAISEIFAPS